MTGFEADRSHDRRQALTLIEVLLTLCLLVLLASITWPALERPMANQRLRKAADAVRVEWTRARVKAMSTGQTQVFRYAAESDCYLIESRAGIEFVADDVGASYAADAGSEPGGVIQSNERTLPDKITFVAGESEYEARAEVLDLDSQEISSSGLSWSDPILFYPDGTTSTATVQLKNEHDRTIEVFLRGLTGLATSGKARSAEEYVP